jgi:hypothetical protein
VQYGVARAFADVSLSVQHDFQEDTISVSDMGSIYGGLGRAHRCWAGERGGGGKCGRVDQGGIKGSRF